MAYIKDVQVGSDIYLIEPALYIAPSKSGAAYTAALANFSLITGATVQAKFAATNDANATLNVNSTGAKEIHYNGAKITANQFKANHVYTLVYDGTQWQVSGDIDTNTWRGIQDNLTSDSTTDSLSARQGKVLKGLIDAMDASTPAASGNTTAFIDSITQTDGKITSITKKNIPAASTNTAGIVKIGTTANDAAAGNHNHNSAYSAIHQSSWSWAEDGTKPLSKYVTFNTLSESGNMMKAPGTGWYNGFVTSHNDYLASFIVNAHRSDRWYVGYEQYPTNELPYTTPTWYLLAHSGNVETGDNNGQVKIAGQNVSVKGLKALAYKDSLSWTDITGKPTTLSGYGITDQVFLLQGGTTIPANADMATYTTIGNYRGPSDANAKTVTNTPYGAAASDSHLSFTLKVEASLGSGTSYLRQHWRGYNSGVEAERTSTNSGSTWSTWRTKVFKNSNAATKEGNTNKPVYIAANGQATAISYEINKSVPANAVFTDTNKYHKTGSWSGLTYTASAVNDADELKFTLPTGTTATTLATGDHSHTLTIGNKSLSVGASEQEWTVHDILYSANIIRQSTSWDIITPGIYAVGDSSHDGSGHPGSTSGQTAPYPYGHLIVTRASSYGAAQFYISHVASGPKAANKGIRYRSGWNVDNTGKTEAERWQEWATILDDKNFNLYAPTLTGAGASGSWGISVTGTAANVTGTVAIEHGGTGATTASAAANALISGLPTWTATPTADTYFIRRDTTGAAAFGQVKFSSIANITNNTLTLGPYSSTLVTSVNGNIGAVTITAADLGLSNALHFIGITSTILADGSTTTTLTAKSTNSLSKTTGFVDGDVVMDGDQLREYVWSGDAWRLLGFTTSNIYNSDSITASSSDEPTWISNIQQATDGTISVQRQTIGTLGIGHGGTGKSEWTQWGIVYASATNTLAQVTAGASTNINQPLISGGAAAPEWYAGLTLAGNGTQESPYDAIFNNTVTITGATTLSSTLSVAENSTLTGKVGIGASPDNNYQLYVNGNSQFNGNLIPTITDNNADKTLGSSDNRWAKLYIGNADNHGDAYTPVYWNDGAPATVVPVQYCQFTIKQSKVGVTLTHEAFTENSYVLQIVVTSGESNLNSPIRWASYSSGELALFCLTPPSGDVSGYILVSRGDSITPQSADLMRLPPPPVDPPLPPPPQEP